MAGFANHAKILPQFRGLHLRIKDKIAYFPLPLFFFAITGTIEDVKKGEQNKTKKLKYEQAIHIF